MRWRPWLFRGLLGSALLGAVLWGAFEVWVRNTELPPLDTEMSDLVYAKDGELLAAYTTSDGFWRFPISIDAVDPKYLNYLIAYEDRRFDNHSGVDLRALGRSFWEVLTHGRIVSGGSTLTMQTARLLSDLPTRSLSAKLSQIRMALAMERRFTKQEILSLYLENAPFGGNIEGVSAASYAFFGKPPNRLTEGEAALLVAIPQSPNARRPDRNPKTARAARTHVLARLIETDVLRDPIAHEAQNEPMPTTLHDFPRYALHLANRYRGAQKQLTIDVDLQARLERFISRKISTLPPGVSGTVLVVDRHSHEVRAYLGALAYGDRKRRGYIDMARAVRSPGSTLKPLIFGMGFSEGLLHPDTLIDDVPARFGDYQPSNFDGQYLGLMTAREALRTSRNIPSLLVLDRLGVDRLLHRLERAGVTPQHNTTDRIGLAIGVGGIGVTPLEMAGLYTMLFNTGSYQPLRLVDGQKSPPPVRVLTQAAAMDVVSVLRNPLAPGGRQTEAVAYKTGTSYGYRDAWAIGGDGQHVVLVQIGRADNESIPEITGFDTAAPILFDIFDLLGVKRLYEAEATQRMSVLPEHLRYFRAGPSVGASEISINYPPENGLIEICGAGIDADISGGTPPFLWLLNGHVLRPNGFTRAQALDITDDGYYTLSVVDAQNQTSRAHFRVTQRPCQ